MVVLPVRASPDKDVPPAVGAPAHAPVTWQLLANLSRVSGQVVKDILLVHVVVPDDVDERACLTPDVIRRFSVFEVPVRRYLPERDR